MRRLALVAGSILMLATGARGARALERVAGEPESPAAEVSAARQRLVLHDAQQEILRFWQAAHPGEPLPYGLTLEPRPARAARVAGTASAPATAALPQLADFGPNRRANNPALDLFGDAGQSGPAVAGLGDHVVMAWMDGDGYDRASPDDQLIGYGYSIDGGTTWTDAGSPPQLPGHGGWQWKGSPSLTVDESNGEFILAGAVYPDGLASPGPSNGIAVVKGTFTGNVFSWGIPVLVASGLNSTETHDQPWVAVDPANGHLYVSFTRASLVSNEIDYSYSIDGGETWTAKLKISSNTDNGRLQGSRIAVGPNGEIYVVWRTVGQIDRDFFRIRKSTGAGVAFGTEVNAANVFSNFGSGAPGYNRSSGSSDPRLAVDRTLGPYRGRVYLAWNEGVDFYTSDLNNASVGNISETEGSGVFGQNDNATRARVFTVGNRVRGQISDLFNDVDYFRFSATQGQTCVFYVDSVASTLDMDFRLLCSDSTTKLAFSSLGKGAKDLIVWTAPETGNYYLRIEPRPNTSVVGTQRYRIHTSFHTNPGDDRARDMRDIYVASSANGTVWPTSGPGAPLRVNDDLPWFDNWLPEIAITGDSRVFCTWYDWRDSAPGKCGGQSALYLFRSDDAGATWTNLGTLTDALSDWSQISTNLEPNQGTALSLFANATGVYPAWGDARNGNPDVYTVPIAIATPSLASLASSRVAAGRVELEWLAAEHANREARLERRGDDAGWSLLATEQVDAEGRVRFVDATAEAGRHYGYRLAFVDGGGITYSQEAEIDVPSGLALALGGPQPNPAVSGLWLSITLPAAQPATLSLVDIAGRVVRRRDVGALGVGSHRVNLAEGAPLPAGVYVVVLRQAGLTRTARAAITR